MKIFEGYQHLIDDVSLVNVLQQTLADYIVHVGLHVVEEDVHIPVILSAKDLAKTDNVWVVELFQNCDLPICSLSIC